MTDEVKSTLGWLDTSEHERRSVLELVSALNEPGTLDELGIGSIRDTVADTLFPGTSTIQTRARYFLFIPWILQTIEAGSHRYAEDRARRLQLQLCHALDKAHGPNAGVIGREAGAALQRWPLSIYWLGLDRWGIRRHPGSITSYFASLRRPSSWLLLGRALEEPVEGRRDETVDGVWSNWADIPDAPRDFLKARPLRSPLRRDVSSASASFSPTQRAFLRTSFRAAVRVIQMLQTIRGTTLRAQSARPSVREWLHDARLFSLVHRGAVLLYNLMLARELENTDRIDEFSTGLAEWSESMSASRPDLEHWDREAMWRRLLGANPRLRRPTREFADRWYELAATPAVQAIGELPEAQRLIREREHALKRGRARLTYAEARDRRQGYPTSACLEFRWTQGKRITSDILEALE